MKKTLRLERRTLRTLRSPHLAGIAAGVMTDATLTIVIETLKKGPVSRLSDLELRGCCGG